MRRSAVRRGALQGAGSADEAEAADGSAPKVAAATGAWLADKGAPTDVSLLKTRLLQACADPAYPCPLYCGPTHAHTHTHACMHARKRTHTRMHSTPTPTARKLHPPARPPSEHCAMGVPVRAQRRGCFPMGSPGCCVCGGNAVLSRAALRRPMSRLRTAPPRWSPRPVRTAARTAPHAPVPGCSGASATARRAPRSARKSATRSRRCAPPPPIPGLPLGHNIPSPGYHWATPPLPALSLGHTAPPSATSRPHRPSQRYPWATPPLPGLPPGPHHRHAATRRGLPSRETRAHRAQLRAVVRRRSRARREPRGSARAAAARAAAGAPRRGLPTAHGRPVGPRRACVCVCVCVCVCACLYVRTRAWACLLVRSVRLLGPSRAHSDAEAHGRVRRRGRAECCPAADPAKPKTLKP
jgi:hypothetical protein